MGMRLLVTGDREWHSRAVVEMVLERVTAVAGVDVLIHGACRGADLFAQLVAEEMGVPVLPYPAQWKVDGRVDHGAGIKRNQRMLTEGRPDFVVAFHDHLISQSRGTLDMVRRCLRAEMPVSVWTSKGIGMACELHSGGISLVSFEFNKQMRKIFWCEVACGERK